MKNKPHIAAIIPARYGSTRLHAKPLIDLCGKPMIQHVYERANQASLVNHVVVATDDDRIVQCVNRFGGDAMMTPAEIPTGSDRIAWAAERLPDADIIVNVQGDEPLISPRMIDEAIAPLLDDSFITVNTLAKVITDSKDVLNPNVVKVTIDTNGYALYFSRSTIPYIRDEIDQSCWISHHRYYKHFGIYVYRRDMLMQFAAWKESSLERAEKLEQLRLLENGSRIKVTLTEFDTVPIDIEADAQRVREIMQKEQSLKAPNDGK
ncbi:MAG: 3-deoxy-manno-octulosonate cytidylyltransferase [Bacteroidota bacterium]